MRNCRKTSRFQAGLTTLFLMSASPVCRASGGFVTRRLQIDVYANSRGEAQLLARAIDRVLNCYRGTLNDDDSTLVFGCFRSDVMDTGADRVTRAFRRILEYEIDFCDDVSIALKENH